MLEYPDTEPFQDGGIKVRFYVQIQLELQCCCFAISLEDVDVIVYSERSVVGQPLRQFV